MELFFLFCRLPFKRQVLKKEKIGNGCPTRPTELVDVFGGASPNKNDYN